MENFSWPLMFDNVLESDRSAMIEHLSNSESRLTHGEKVKEFETKWNEWLGTQYSVMLNSGSSANDLTMLALKYMHGKMDVVVPALTWVSDIASVFHAGHRPIFCDITLETLAPTVSEIENRISKDKSVVFLTHILGLAALTDRELNYLADKHILIEDVCESHGAYTGSKKIGTYGLASNFSFYFAHHMTTMEGGIVSTSSEDFYETIRMLRSHGLVREIANPQIRMQEQDINPDLNSDFIFKYLAHNMRPIELQGVLGIEQLGRLSLNCEIRAENFHRFTSQLDSSRYFTNFRLEGNSSYAFIVILNEPDLKLRNLIEETLRASGIEFRRGLSGGGNQLRQPYIKYLDFKVPRPEEFPVADHVHNFGWYIGNYPGITASKIDMLCSLLNSI